MHLQASTERPAAPHRRRFIIQMQPFLWCAVGLVMLTTGHERVVARQGDGAVHALFNVHLRNGGPFPSDVFTVPDSAHNTGRRVNLPYPDCAVRVSDCQDLEVINTLDGFGLQTRLSIPFDGAIDVNTVTSEAVFLIRLGSTIGRVGPGEGHGDGDRRPVKVGINQVVWDVPTNTLHVESDVVLAQHTRYALIVTSGVRDETGSPVAATAAFRRFRRTVRGEYKHALLEAIRAARRLGIRERDIVTASVYTTQTVTSVMERIRDAIKNGTPAPANFLLGPNGERAVYSRGRVANIVLVQQNQVSPPAFITTSVPLALLDTVPGAVGAIAHGSYQSPVYIERPAGTIPTVGTLSGVPPVQTYETVYFTVYLPSGTAPVSGWPVVITGAAGTRHQIQPSMAAVFASRGIATIGIGSEGFGFGPLGSLRTTFTDGTSLTIPDAGRSYDQDGNNQILGNEGSTASANRLWTVGESDPQKQTTIDLLQLVRVIEVGVDVDGDGAQDLDASRISFHGQSAGGRFGSMLAALDPSVRVVTVSGCCGISPEHGRLSPMRRPGLGRQLASRVPSLINAGGLTSIDGVAVAAPFYDENKPLRNRAAVTNAVAGAIDIQEAFEIHEWGQQSGQTSHTWMLHLRKSPLAGMGPKAVAVYVFKTDQQTVNPSATEALGEAALFPYTLYYRHDAAFDQDPTVPPNPHMVVVSPTSPNVLFRSVSRGAQAHIADFHASGGIWGPPPEPSWLWEVPMLERPDSLNFIR